MAFLVIVFVFLNIFCKGQSTGFDIDGVTFSSEVIKFYAESEKKDFSGLTVHGLEYIIQNNGLGTDCKIFKAFNAKNSNLGSDVGDDHDSQEAGGNYRGYNDENDKNDDQNDNEKIGTLVNNRTLFDYSEQNINGVNLGGWLVTEPYITPSFYLQASKDGNEASVPVDEYHYCQFLGTGECHRRLKAHWDTFIVESDFIKIKSFGLNAVRLPIGYWAFAHLEDDPYCFGQEEYLQKAIQWCRNSGLKLWIDLHGVPGSQNGFDNSGLRDHLEWMSISKNYELANRVLDYMFAKYGSIKYQDVIIGLQNLNEPIGGVFGFDKINKFNMDSYKSLRSKSNNYLVVHDAFMPYSYWNDKLTGEGYKNIILDHHRYEVFTPAQLRQTIEEHISALKTFSKSLKKDRLRVVGEWSAALTDCAKWLNGVNIGTRMENTYASDRFIGDCRYSNDISKLSEMDKINTRKIIEAQLDIYGLTNGYFFWCYKTENAIEWDLAKLIELGLFPQPLNDRRYPKIV